MEKRKTLKIGLWIVHTQHGLGQISDMAKRCLGEVEKDYFCVKISDGEYWLAIENMDSPRIRIISSEKNFREALSILQMDPEKLPDDFRFRSRYIDEQIGTGTLTTIAALIRDIYGKRQEGGLSITEKQRFNNICQRFVDEWRLVMGISNEEAQVNLEKAFLQISMKA